MVAVSNRLIILDCTILLMLSSRLLMVVLLLSWFVDAIVRTPTLRSRDLFLARIDCTDESRTNRTDSVGSGQSRSSQIHWNHIVRLHRLNSLKSAILGLKVCRLPFALQVLLLWSGLPRRLHFTVFVLQEGGRRTIFPISYTCLSSEIRTCAKGCRL